MITKEEFVKFIQAYEEFEEGIDNLGKFLSGDRLYGVNLWDSNWVDAVCKMWDQFMYSHFTEEGSDLINWWKFEDVDHIITQTVDPDLFHGKSEIEYDVNNIEDLWDFLMTDKKLYFKNYE